MRAEYICMFCWCFVAWKFGKHVLLKKANGTFSKLDKISPRSSLQTAKYMEVAILPEALTNIPVLNIINFNLNSASRIKKSRRKEVCDILVIRTAMRRNRKSRQWYAKTNFKLTVINKFYFLLTWSRTEEEQQYKMLWQDLSIVHLRFSWLCKC